MPAIGTHEPGQVGGQGAEHPMLRSFEYAAFSRTLTPALHPFAPIHISTLCCAVALAFIIMAGKHSSWKCDSYRCHVDSSVSWLPLSVPTLLIVSVFLASFGAAADLPSSYLCSTCSIICCISILVRYFVHHVRRFKFVLDLNHCHRLILDMTLKPKFVNGYVPNFAQPSSSGYQRLTTSLHL